MDSKGEGCINYILSKREYKKRENKKYKLRRVNNKLWRIKEDNLEQDHKNISAKS